MLRNFIMEQWVYPMIQQTKIILNKFRQSINNNDDIKTIYISETKDGSRLICHHNLKLQSKSSLEGTK